MAFSHSFAADFYGDVYNAAPCKRPTNLADAIASIDEETWAAMAADIFDCAPEFLDVETVFLTAIKTDTVGDYCTPVDVWIDSEGFYRVDVY